MKKAYQVLRIVLPLLGLFLGAIKFFGHPVEVETFSRFGTPPWFRMAFGAAQAFFGLIILFPALELTGIVASIVLLAVAMSLMLLNGMIPIFLVPLAGIATITFFAFARKSALGQTAGK